MTSARVAETEVCNSKSCSVSHLLVRGDRIEFVSTEQVKAVGRHPLSETEMPSDIKLPKGYVLVHDANGVLFNRCHFYVVKWQSTRTSLSKVHEDDIKVAQEYFDNAPNLQVGAIQAPKGPWKRIAKVQFIRYNRYGYDKGFEHEYDPTVFLYSTHNPLAWRLTLPNGCIVDERGFVNP
jgi:hypothetical protein